MIKRPCVWAICDRTQSTMEALSLCEYVCTTYILRAYSMARSCILCGKSHSWIYGISAFAFDFYISEIFYISDFWNEWLLSIISILTRMHAKSEVIAYVALMKECWREVLAVLHILIHIYIHARMQRRRWLHVAHLRRNSEEKLQHWFRYIHARIQRLRWLHVAH